MKRPIVLYQLLIVCLYVLTAVPATAAEDTYKEDTVMSDVSDFFGEGAEGVGKVVKKLFSDLGEPNGYIKGTEASGALGVGARYGHGVLYMKSGKSTEVHWTGPSIGFDAGGDVSKVFVLVYHLHDVNMLFQRFPAVDGSLYVVGGVSANYHRSDGIILAPIRLGAGLRTGVNVGYMKYTRKKTWNPF